MNQGDEPTKPGASDLARDIGESLRKARYLTLLGSPISEQANRLIDHLAAEIQRVRPVRTAKANAAPLRTAVGALIADLLCAENKEAGRWSYRTQSPGAFTDEEVTYRTYMRVRLALSELEFIETLRGFTPRDGEQGFRMRGWTGRLRATPPLLRLAGTFGVRAEEWPNHFQAGLPTVVLELRKPLDVKARRASKGPGKRVRYKKTDTTRRLSEEVHEINAFLALHDIRGCTHAGFRRIFTSAPRFKWDKHGRLYSIGADCYQQLPQERRIKDIRIDGEAVTEVDIRACSLTIAYALLREPIDTSVDPYVMPGLPRSVAKSWITMTLGNDKMHQRWSADAAKRFRNENPAAKQSSLGRQHRIGKVQEMILERHPVLKRYHGSGITILDLMFADSEVMMATMLRLIRNDAIPALPVHDSLIVRERDAERAKQVLTEEFQKRVGVTPYVRIEG